MWCKCCPHNRLEPEGPQPVPQFSCRSELARKKLKHTAFLQCLRVIVNPLREQARSYRNKKAPVTAEVTGAFAVAPAYISIWVPSSITRFTGSLKKRRLPLAFLSMKANSVSRQRAMPTILEVMTVSRLRK